MTDRMRLPRLVVAGAHSGAGKTTFSLALMRALTRRGMTVHPYKIGPDYIDPAFHQAAAGRPSRNLDAWLLPPRTLTRLFRRSSCADAPALCAEDSKTPRIRPRTPDARPIAVIEGVMGLFDGQGAGSLGSTAHVASLLKAPVILLINGEGLSLSAAALVSGYAAFQPHTRTADARIAAVLVNRVSGPRHYALLRQCIEERCALPCLGCLPKNAVAPLPGRHLGLVPAGELADLEAYLEDLAALAEEHWDIDALISLAENAQPLPPFTGKTALHPAKCETAVARSARSSGPSAAHSPARARIGLARDEAFSFYYQDTLELLEELGAELVPFSPLRDSSLPEALDGLYLGGGFPEIFALELEANQSMRAAIRAALESGLPAYAECGGLLYLCASLGVPAKDGAAPRRFAMTGFFPEQAEMTGRLQPFGYITLTLRQDCLIGKAGTRLRAHEFHYARLLAPEAPARPTPAVFAAAKDNGARWPGGLSRENTLAMFPHLHFHSCPRAAARFLERCRHERGNRACPQKP
jgi:cobyrinic acid a,c-diamide synthase